MPAITAAINHPFKMNKAENKDKAQAKDNIPLCNDALISLQPHSHKLDRKRAMIYWQLDQKLVTFAI